DTPARPGGPQEGRPAPRVTVVAAHVGPRLAAREPQLDRFAYTRRDGGHGHHRLFHGSPVSEVDDEVYVTRPPLLATQAAKEEELQSVATLQSQHCPRPNCDCDGHPGLGVVE